MARKQKPAVERVFDAWAELTTEQQAEFGAFVRGYQRANGIGEAPQPKRTRGPVKKANGAAVANMPNPDGSGYVIARGPA